jgi:hypothetical protein
MFEQGIYRADQLAGVSSIFDKQVDSGVELLVGWDACRVW